MHTLAQGYRGMSLLVRLNADRLIYIVTILLALMAGAWLGSL